MKFDSFPKKNEDTIIHDQEKAREMAEVEDEYRETAIALKQYMEDPVAYRASEDERVQKAKEDGAFTSSDANDYMELYRAGVRPRDLEGLGERMAEYHAREYDFANEVASQSALALHATIAWFKLEQHFYSRSYDKTADQADFGMDRDKSYVASHLLNQLGKGEENASVATRIHEWLAQSERMQQIAEAELERRKSGEQEKLAA